nr:CbrC family protein [Streptomyces sp. SID4948]
MSVDARTPGFFSRQDPRWFFHCGDGTTFLGAVGAGEPTAFPHVMQALRSEAAAWGWAADEVEDHLRALDKDGQPAAYLFRCRTCATHLVCADLM